MKVPGRVAGALSWGILVAAAVALPAMAVGAWTMRLDGHALGFLGATATLVVFVPGL